MYPDQEASVLLTFALLPVKTRLYGPRSYGGFQLLITLIPLFSIIALLKYEMAIVLPQDDGGREAVMALSFWTLIGSLTLYPLLVLTQGRGLFESLNAD